jgi:prevent-host-death family protein
MRSIRASEFKAKCLAILDEVERTGEPVTILKRGRPVARLLPPVPEKGRYPQHALFGTVRIVGDVVEPVLPAGDWDAERGEL